jgi:hypothetical protein
MQGRSGALRVFLRYLHRQQLVATDLSRAVSLDTTNRYAEITVRMKEAAMKLCEPPTADRAPRTPAWRDDAALLSWLASL